MKFSEMPYSRPDIDALIAKCNEALEKFVAAETVQEQIEIFSALDKEQCALYDMESIVYIRNSVDMNDEFYAAEREYLDNNLPKVYEAVNNFNKALLESKFQSELRKEFGDYMFDCLEMQQRSFSPAVIDLMAKDAELYLSDANGDISAEAAYEAADGTVRSAWQRNELVLRGSFLRGGYIANQGAFAGLTPVSE